MGRINENRWGVIKNEICILETLQHIAASKIVNAACVIMMIQAY